MCLRNYSCTAYANSNIKGGSGCLLWFDDLIDIRYFTQNGLEFYVRMVALKLGVKYFFFFGVFIQISWSIYSKIFHQLLTLHMSLVLSLDFSTLSFASFSNVAYVKNLRPTTKNITSWNSILVFRKLEFRAKVHSKVGIYIYYISRFQL